MPTRPRVWPKRYRSEVVDLEAELEIRLKVAHQSNQLDLSDLGLTKIPEPVFELVDLVVLDLSANDLQDLPTPLASLTKLRHIDLDGNDLTALPEWLSR